jgi:O-antigen/teichoic acid export membrane protein
MSWRKFGADSILLAIATVALAFLQWSILMFIARVDGPSLLGEYSLAQAYAGPAFFLGSLSLRAQYLVLQPSRSLFSDFLFLRLVFPGFVFACLLLFIHFYYISPTFISIATAIFAMKYVEGFFDLVSGKMQREGDVIGVATTSATRCLFSIIAFGAIYLATRNLPLALFFLPAIWIVFFLLQRKRLNINVQLPEVLTVANFKRRLGLAVSLFPFSVSLIVNSLALNAPRFILDAALGPKDLGFFSAISHFLTIGALVTGSVAQMALPALVDAITKDSSRKFWQRLVWPAAMVQCGSIVGVIIAIAMGPELLNLFYGRQFESQSHTLVVAAIVGGPVYCSFIFVNGCYATQMRRELLAIQCLSLLVVVTATLILVPRFGVDGAYFGMAIFAITQICLSIALLLRFFYLRRLSVVSNPVP